MNGNRTSSRLRHAIILALGLGIGNFAFALRLGPINVKSYLGQPINATIRVDGLSAAAASNTKVSLASPAAYRSHGIEMLPIHSQMRFSLTPSGKSYIIHVSSTSGVKEPFVNFLVTVSGNGSTVTREYAAFFNPNPANTSAGKSNNPTVVVEKERGHKNNKVLAERANPPKTRSHAANTSGWGGKPAKKTPPKKAEPVRPAAAPAPAAAVASGSPNTPSSIPVNSHYGPIKPGETLYSIAKAARPSESVRIPDMMRLIYKANRRAFARNNMGNLMAGATLYIPDPGQRKSAASSKPAPEPKAAKPTPKPEPKAKPTPPKPEPKTPKIPTPPPAETSVKPEVMPTSPNAQLAFGVDNEEKKVEAKKTEIPTPPVVAEKEEPQPQGLKVKVDPPESIETKPKVEVPPPVIELPKPEPVELPPEEEFQPEPQPQPAPPPPPKPAPVVRQPAPAPIPAPPPADDSFFGLGKYIPDFGIPLPLLGGAFAGLLALLGGLFWFLKKRKKANADDQVEEFTEEQIQRMVAEMEEEHGELDFDQITSTQANHDPNHEPPMITKLDPISEPYADDSTGSIEEISDDFFKDLEVNVEENADTGFLADETIADSSEISDNFFDDLEFDQDETPATEKTAKAADTVADDFDDFLTGSDFSNDDFLDDLDNEQAFTELEHDLDKPKGGAATPAIDDFDDFLTTTSPTAEDDFFADPESDAFSELPAAKSTANNDNSLDFLDGLDITETPAEAEKPQLELTKDDSTLDFFTDIEQPKESKKAETVDFSTVNDDNTLDFFTTEDEKQSTNLAAENDFFADEVVDLKKEETKTTTAETLDFFTDPVSETVVPESTAAKPAAAKISKPAAKLPPITPPTVDEDAMEINLDMAKSFISMGKSEKARSWLEEVLELGTDAQKAQANKMLAKIEKG